MDDDGNELGSGIMELTDTELILYTRKRDSVKWHYLCLRRYGYDSNLFSFESGRRCQTGQGMWKHCIESFLGIYLMLEETFQSFGKSYKGCSSICVCGFWRKKTL